MNRTVTVREVAGALVRTRLVAMAVMTAGIAFSAVGSGAAPQYDGADQPAKSVAHRDSTEVRLAQNTTAAGTTKDSMATAGVTPAPTPVAAAKCGASAGAATAAAGYVPSSALPANPHAVQQANAQTTPNYPGADANQTDPTKDNAPITNPDDQTAVRTEAENRLRSAMSSVGIDDSATQDALLDYLAEDEQGKAVVRDAAKRMVYALRHDAPPDSLRQMVDAYKGAVTSDSSRRAQAQAALDTKIGFSANPRLEAVLLLVGVLGDGQPAYPASSLLGRISTHPSAAPSTAAGGTADGANPPTPAAPATTGDNPPATSMPSAAASAAHSTTGPIVVDPNGSVTGTVEGKGVDWVEVKDDATGQTERYMPASKSGTPDAKIMQVIIVLNIGDRVQFDWVWNTRKRIVSITQLPAAAKN